MSTYIPRERVITNNQGSPGDTLLVLRSQEPSLKYKILAVPNSVVFCSGPILTLIPMQFFNSFTKFLGNTSKGPYKNRYYTPVLYTPHSSNLPFQILIFFDFFKFLFLYPTISRNSYVHTYTFFLLLAHYDDVRSSCFNNVNTLDGYIPK